MKKRGKNNLGWKLLPLRWGERRRPQKWFYPVSQNLSRGCCGKSGKRQKIKSRKLDGPKTPDLEVRKRGRIIIGKNRGG